MHISEGILATQVLATGAVLTVTGTAIGLKKIKDSEMPKIAVLSAAFFVASLIRIPFGFSSVHLVLNGLLGIILGWAAFPAILIALLLQALLFQFGGLIVLFVNVFNLAMPAVVCFYLFNRLIRKANRKSIVFFLGLFIGFIAISLSALLLSISLFTTGKEFFKIAGILFVSHIPVMIIEGLITGSILVFLKKVKPEILWIKK